MEAKAESLKEDRMDKIIWLRFNDWEEAYNFAQQEGVCLMAVVAEVKAFVGPQGEFVRADMIRGIEIEGT